MPIEGDGSRLGTDDDRVEDEAETEEGEAGQEQASLYRVEGGGVADQVFGGVGLGGQLISSIIFSCGDGIVCCGCVFP